MRNVVIRMLVIVFVVFVVCYTPQQVIVLHVNAYEISKRVPPWLQYATIYITYFNSAMNPILYAGLNDNFRKGFWEVIGSRKRKTRVFPAADVGVKQQRNGHVNPSDTLSTKQSPQRSDPTPEQSKDESERKVIESSTDEPHAI
ncbi:hypothetical protein CAPTEDRAFT_192492 [Capitella teleta]|uniref:G-protein coupled receptors family 1 profile domain-containing protein n=1 Tax=Capitella teleta TaxID=283909 RepID=R7U2R5_CAPTE|nr:hypothetical protein CAPTEDRAFT_192492 [Capitella teleta]|eukprot:ELU00396.1 hypothetical protein CAPTEDRAFT_192492 [Capitella teleta]